MPELGYALSSEEFPPNELVRLAQRAEAARFAPEALQEAQRALDHTLDLWHRRVNRSEIAAQARVTVRLALTAQHLAEDRAFQARLEVEGSGEEGANPRGVFRAIDR